MTSLRAARQTLGLACVLSLCGCGPNLIWFGTTPDRSQRVELQDGWGGQRIVIGEAAGERYDGIAPSTVLFGPNGRLAYAATQDDRWRVVVDGVEQPGRWDGVAGLTLAEDGSVVYLGQKGPHWHVVVDDVPGAPWDAIFDGSLGVNEGRVGYVAQRGDCVTAVIDGVQGDCHREIANLIVGARSAYLARGEEAHAVLDGQRGPGYDDVRDLQRCGDGWAYVARSGSSWFAVIRGERRASHDEVRELQCAFGRSAYVARSGPEEAVFVDTSGLTTWPEVRRNSLVLGAKGHAFVVLTDAGEQLHGPDGPLTPVLPHVGDPVYGPRGAQLAFSQTHKNGVIVIIDGEPLHETPLRWTGRPVVGVSGVAVAVRTENSMGVLDGRGLHPFDLVMEGSVVIGNSGRWGALVGTKDSDEVLIAVDGKIVSRLDSEEVAAEVLRNPNETALTQRLRAIVLAEIARAPPR